jgi:serine/threonine protein kinase
MENRRSTQRAAGEAAVTGPGLGAGLEGSTLGPYQLVRRVGGAGLGEVYQAQRIAPADPTQPGVAEPRQVAIKLLRPGANDPITGQIVSACEAAAALHERHIIPLYGVASQGERVGVVMAWASGGSLGDTLSREGGRTIRLPLAPAVVARLATQIGHSLAAAHAHGLIHGDLKPSNVFVRTSPRGSPIAVVSDFGQSDVTPLAAQLLATGVPAARESWAQQQLLFAAPEQLSGALTPASDQYALAALVYYLLTGRPPLMGAGETLLSQLASAEPPPVTQLNPDAPASLDDILGRALSKRPEQRYPSVEGFVRALDDSLAEARSSVAGGVTGEFARLGAGRRATNAPAFTASAPEESAAGLPADPPPTLWRPLAIATMAALLIAALTCAISVFALNGASNVVRTTLSGFEGPNAAPTISTSANLSDTPEGRQAEAQLRGFTSQQPLFSDTLTSNSSKWPITKDQVFFGSDHQLHIVNTTVSQPVAADAPISAPAGDYVSQVTMTMTSGVGGDLAGMRFFVTDLGDGTTSYYAFFLSPDGQYYLWYYHNAWIFLSGGYAPQVKRGDGVTNTLAVIALGDAHKALLFVNGAYIGSAALRADGPVSGDAGVIVLNHGVEATYSHFALYPAHS